jgi:TolB-like protein
MIGRTLSHYEITAKLGAGGMGEVYRATDTKLGRDVALKVLPAEMASSAERLERFRREAKALAALDHPGIVTVFSVEEADGVHFLTMQLVEGKSLDSFIPEGGLPAEQIVDIGARIAGALAAAHDKGIVHRDLKPANVMVTAEGRVKVLDFGLARMGEVEEGPSGSHLPTELLTREGVVMGTVPYMSPEQVSGLAVDHRSDIFSLGVILYEMAIGRRPFEGPSSAELASAILRDTPPQLGELRAGLPDGLAQVIGRCLEKDAADRVPSARALGDALGAVHGSQRSVPTTVAPASRPVAEDSSAARADEGFWIAVLPFKYKGASSDLVALAEGLSEEIVTGLARFSYLRVIARTSTERYAGDAIDIRAFGEKFGARYVMEGSLRQAGAKLRLAVQLVDATSGTHLWAETYERTFSSEALFELQDDLVPRIVSTVADTHGVLPRSMGGELRSRAPEELSSYEAVLRSFAYFDRVSAEEQAAAHAALELAVRRAPAYADAWALLALLCAQDYGQGFGNLEDPLASAAAAAQRAVEMGPSNHLAHFSLAQVLFFQRQYGSLRNTAERAAALNPMDGNSIAFLGELLTYSGEFERGLELAGRAKQLNPNHPGWYWYADVYNAYRQGNYRGALGFALKVNLPSHWGLHVYLAAAYGQLGETAGAEKAVRDLLELRPDFTATAREKLERWWEPEYVEHLIEGCRKAGLEVPSMSPSEAPSSAAGPRSLASRPTPTEEGFWVAVLPFKHSSADYSLAALAEGLSEEIVTGLSRFSYLRVIARSSTERYSGEVIDVRAVGKEIGARYVMEGSLRPAGSKMRVAAQLIDASTGSHLWAETYDRTFRPGDTFALQDDLVPRIVSTVADWYGVLPQSMSEAVRRKPPDRLSSYEAVLRSFGYFERITPDEHAAMRAALERAVEQAPGNADGWAMLSMMYGEEHRFGFNLEPDPLGRSLQAARRAVDAAHANHFAWLALAQALFFRREFDAFRDAAERVIALNPMDGSTLEYVGHLMAFSGDWEGGCEVAGRARQLNPNHPGWYWVVHFLDHYRQGGYREARPYILKTVLRGGGAQVFTQALLAAVHGQLGEREQAEQALRNILSQEPGYAGKVRGEFSKWYLPELVEQLMEGLRKAGLGAP